MVITTSEIKPAPTQASAELSNRERVLALRAKLKPISQNDADAIDNAIIEAREASISCDLPT